MRVKAGEVGPGLSFSMDGFVDVKGNIGYTGADAFIVEV